MLPARKLHLLCVVNVPWLVTSRGLTSGSIYTFVCDTHTMWPRRTWWAAVIWEIPEDTTREPLFEACCWKHSEEGITLVCMQGLVEYLHSQKQGQIESHRSETYICLQPHVRESDEQEFCCQSNSQDSGTKKPNRHMSFWVHLVLNIP